IATPPPWQPGERSHDVDGAGDVDHAVVGEEVEPGLASGAPGGGGRGVEPRGPCGELAPHAGATRALVVEPRIERRGVEKDEVVASALDRRESGRARARV